MDEKKVMEELKKQAGDEISINEDMFKDGALDSSTDEMTVDELADIASPGMGMPSMTIDEKMELLGLTKDQVIDMIISLSDDGYIEDDVSIFGGKFSAKFRTSKLTDTKRFIDMFDAMDINTQAKTEYYLNLYALASILLEFNGKKVDEEVDGDVIRRASWIEKNIPTPIYKTLIDEANKFHQKIELLNSKEVADFF